MPAEVDQGQLEVLPRSIDFAVALTAYGDTIASATATLIDIAVGSTTGVVGAPTVNGTVVTAMVSGLSINRRYELVMSITTVTAPAKTWSAVQMIRCTD